MSRKNSHTATLFHFTKNQNTLFSILKRGLKFSFCKEDIADDAFVAPPMISFCDIPLLSCKEHRSKYGTTAIGFDKESFANIGKGLQIGTVNYFKGHQYELTKMLTSMIKDKNKNVGWFKQFEQKRNEKNQCNYDECEWRLLAFSRENGDDISWFWDKTEYRLWREQQKDKFLEDIVIRFKPSDIKYIVVNQESTIVSTVKKILKLTQFAGNKITQEEKEILCSRIISFENLKSDF